MMKVFNCYLFCLIVILFSSCSNRSGCGLESKIPNSVKISLCSKNSNKEIDKNYYDNAIMVYPIYKNIKQQWASYYYNSIELSTYYDSLVFVFSNVNVTDTLVINYDKKDEYDYCSNLVYLSFDNLRVGRSTATDSVYFSANLY